VVTLSQDCAELADEFSLVAEVTAGRAAGLPCVRRCWADVPTGGQVSGVTWGTGTPELVLLHDRGESARAWDSVGLALTLDLGRPAVAIDLPGHGQSSGRRDGRYEPARITPAVAEAIRWFAPHVRLVAGTGLGGLTALALRRRHPWLVPGIALFDTLPGVPAPGPALAGAGPACDELAQLSGPVTLIRGAGAGAGPLAPAELARLRQHTPQLGVLTLAGIQPSALAVALDGLLGVSLS
jgi:pimeloyl-ACP methyl ester carboxylesterase